MSLYIGNLSSHTHKGELESVFQRYGRCGVRLKDRYGFVVYDFAQNAEKALMALQGRNICGQPLTLTWSNKQPRPCKRFSNAAGSFGPLYGRSSAIGEGYTNRKMHPNGRTHYKFGIKPLDGDVRKRNSADMLDGDTSYLKDYIQEEHCEYREDFPEEGGNFEPNLVENDRWAGQLHDQPNGNSVENGIEIDQYERYRGFDRRAEDENHHIAYSDGSQASKSSQDVLRREHLSDAPLDPPNNSKPQLTCYSCGGTGHKMHNCPSESALQRKLIRLGHRHDDDRKRKGTAEGKLERYGSASHRKLQLYKELSGLGDEGKASGSGRHQRLMKNRSSNRANEADTVCRKDHEGKKRRGNFGTPNRDNEKKAKRSGSLSLHSDYTESILHSTSRSSTPVPKSVLHSRSRSLPSRLCSSTSNSRPSSTSHYSRSTRTKSSSRSKSCKSLSFYESLGKPLPSSPNKVQTNLKAMLDNAVIPKSKEITTDQALPDDVSATAELENYTLAEADSFSKLEKDVDNQPMQREWNDNLIMMSLSSHGISNQSTQQSEKGTLTARSLSSETLKETGQHQNSDASVIMHKPPPINNSTSEAPVSLHSTSSTSISSDEMYMVLKHYGLEHDDENERCLPPEGFFGSARLWPWEIIYYRRLKKGPISTENYARRVAQNQEFRIVDKYVRSSSGWGEGQDNS